MYFRSDALLLSYADSGSQPLFRCCNPQNRKRTKCSELPILIDKIVLKIEKSVWVSSNPAITRATLEKSSEVSNTDRMKDGIYSARADKTSEIGTVNIQVKTKPRSVFQSNRYMYPTQDSIPYFGLRFFDFFVSFLATVIHFSSLPEQEYNQIIQSSFYDTVCWQYARSP